jgi:hypothetical protein
MMKHPAKVAEHEGKKIGEAAAGGVAATAVCNGAAKVLTPCLGAAAEEAPEAVPVAEVVLVDGAGEL